MNNELKPRRETLEHVIKFRTYVALGVGVIVGVGWVVYSGQWLTSGGPAGAMLAFLIGGVLLLPIGMCYAEMTSALPLAGGELSFAYKAFGARLAFMTAWLLALAYTAVAPFETIAMGSMFEALLPGLATETLYSVRIGGDEERVALSTVLPGCAIASLLIWANWHGAKDSARIQMVIVVMMLACTAIFCGAALWQGELANLRPLFANPAGGETSATAVLAAIVSVLVIVPFFMAGFDTIPQAAEEARVGMPLRDLGLAILISIACGSLFYVLIIFSVAIVMPWTEAATLPMTTAAVFESALGYTWAAKLVLFTAFLGLVSTLNGVYVASSRLLFSMGRGGMLPHWFAAVHAEHHTPRNALLFVGAISFAGPFVGKLALSPIVNSSSFAFTVAMTVTCFSAIRLRRTSPRLERPFRAPTAALSAGAFMAVALLVLMLAPGSPGRLGGLETMIVLVWTVAGLLGFLRRTYTHPLEKSEQDYLILGDYQD